MSILIELAKLKKREIKFSTLKTALKHHALLSSNGWSNLESKYSDLNEPSSTISNHASKLKKIYVDNVEWGDKAIQIAQFDVTFKSFFQEIHAKHNFLSEFIPTTDFPSPVSDSEFAKLTLKPQFVRMKSNATGTCKTFYFYSRAYETSKERFDVDEMKDAISLSRFAGFDHVFAVKQTIYLRIDTVFVDIQNQRFEFRVDATRISSTDKMTEALIELKGKFRSILSNQVNTNWETVSFPMTNFFPKINEMYNSVSGELIAIGYNTEAGAINHGKMKGHSGDLKADPSHTASMEASLTEKFSIRKAFSFYDELSKVHLSVLGKSSDTGTSLPTLITAVIEDCIEGEQFEQMMQKLR
jgi:hypothetical protein